MRCCKGVVRVLLGCCEMLSDVVRVLSGRCEGVVRCCDVVVRLL